MTWLISETWTSGEGYNGDIDYILVNMTPELAKTLLGLMDMVAGLQKRDPRIACIQLWDSSFWGIDASKLDECGIEEPCSDTFDELDVTDGENAANCCEARTDCDTLNVRHDSVSWTCAPKHIDVKVWSRRLSRETVEKYL